MFRNCTNILGFGESLTPAPSAVERGQTNSPSPSTQAIFPSLVTEPTTPLPKGYAYVHEIDPTFSPSTVGKWAKSHTEQAKIKNPRDLVASLEGKARTEAKDRMQKAVGTVSETIIGEIAKTLQLIVYQRYDNKNYVLQNHRQITKYLFSPYILSWVLLTVTVIQFNLCR
jgi:hypothetical protein